MSLCFLIYVLSIDNSYPITLVHYVYVDVFIATVFVTMSVLFEGFW